MPLVIANVGEIELLNKMLIEPLTTDESYKLRLYQNNYTPVASSVASDFTEATFTNYVAKTLTRAGWSTPTIVGGKAESSYAQQSWTCGVTGNTIYGYYIEGANSTILLWAERFATPRVLVNTDIITLIPVFTFNSEN